MPASQFPTRIFFLGTALIAAALLAYGYYLQFHDGLEPCPMCVFQRLCYMGLVVIGALAAIHGPGRTGAIVYGTTATVFALIGGAIAGRQVWLQHLPEDRVPECGPGLEFMLEVYPLAEVIKSALRGTGECAAVDWTFMSLSIAEWSLVWFVIFSLACCFCVVQTFRHNASHAEQAERV